MSQDLALLREKAWKFLDLSPAIKDRFFEYYKQSYAPGALDTRTKRLIALCGGIIAGCRGCMLGQLEMAIDEGATPDQVLETLAVAMSLGGTLAWSNIAQVMEHADTLGFFPDSD